MKKRFLVTVVILLLLFCTIVFFACGDGDGNGDDKTDNRPNLTLTSNIDGIAKLTGGGHYDYNEDVSVSVEFSDEYAFLGWYYGKDLLSKSANYNLKMWDRDTTLTATFTKRIKDESGEYVSSDADGKYNLVVRSNIYSLGSVSLNDSSSIDEHKTKEAVGENVKVVAFTKSDKQFLGWYDGENNLIMTNASFEFSMPATDFTLIAKWKCDHNWQNNYIVKMPTCSAEGLKYDRKCTICNEVEGKTVLAIDPNAHNFENNICKFCGVSNGAVGFTYRKISDGKYEITGITEDNISSELTIPSKFYFGDIVAIAKNAFCQNTTIESIIVSEGISEIGWNAFGDCTNLANITLPNGLRYISDHAFSNCTKLESITIPSTVVAVGKFAFNSCKNLNSITVLGDISVGEDAFELCNGLNKITANGEVASAIIKQSYSTLYSTKYYDIDILGLKEIPDEAFLDCKILRSVNIQDGVKKIGSYAFKNCTSLLSISIPKTLRSIDWNAFRECTALEEVNISDLNKWCEIDMGYKSNPLEYAKKLLVNGERPTGNIVLADGVKAIPSYTFYGCNVSSITMPESIELIGENAFYGCTNIQSFHINDLSKWCGVVCENAFANPMYYADNTIIKGNILTELIVPSDVSKIGKYAFAGFTGSNITLNDGLRNIGEGAFFNCHNIIEIEVPNSVENIDASAFYRCSSLKKITIPFIGQSRSNKSDYSSVFGFIFGYSRESVRNGSSITIAQDVENYHYADYYFRYTYNIPTSLEEVIVKNVVTSIPEYAFNNNKSLSKITLPSGITAIPKYAFNGCANLKDIAIP
ncbi:MAG TPA: hypothetical protein DEF02_00125, partial [Clostridiales bacterium]|nr:hypothetical protein [Clostridiales bacterium]